MEVAPRRPPAWPAGSSASTDYAEDTEDPQHLQQEVGPPHEPRAAEARWEPTGGKGRGQPPK
eukprot:9061401-Heterocapsa_arctica.AAC.1